MRFRLQRETFLKPLAHVVNVVERRQTRSILANLLIKVNEDQLSLTGTDLEVEMISKTKIEDPESGEITIPARKIYEIVRALPDASQLSVYQSDDKIILQAGRSRFTYSYITS